MKSKRWRWQMLRITLGVGTVLLGISGTNTIIDRLVFPPEPPDPVLGRAEVFVSGGESPSIQTVRLASSRVTLGMEGTKVLRIARTCRTLTDLRQKLGEPEGGPIDLGLNFRRYDCKNGMFVSVTVRTDDGKIVSQPSLDRY